MPCLVDNSIIHILCSIVSAFESDADAVGGTIANESINFVYDITEEKAESDSEDVKDFGQEVAFHDGLESVGTTPTDRSSFNAKRRRIDDDDDDTENVLANGVSSEAPLAITEESNESNTKSTDRIVAELRKGHQIMERGNEIAERANAIMERGVLAFEAYFDYLRTK